MAEHKGKILQNNNKNDDSCDPMMLKEAIIDAEAIVLGAGNGLSYASGLSYSGKRFYENFIDFHDKYDIENMTLGSLYQFETVNEYFAYWSRHIYLNRYQNPKSDVYKNLLKLLYKKDYHVVTTTLDDLFTENGFDEKKVTAMQGTYSKYQCSSCNITVNNKRSVLNMYDEFKHSITTTTMPDRLIPKCPYCKGPLTVNIKLDDTFVTDKDYQESTLRYANFLHNNKNKKILFIEIGVGFSAPNVIKYPFWFMARDFDNAKYCIINEDDVSVPFDILDRSIKIKSDIVTVLNELL